MKNRNKIFSEKSLSEIENYYQLNHMFSEISCCLTEKKKKKEKKRTEKVFTRISLPGVGGRSAFPPME